MSLKNIFEEYISYVKVHKRSVLRLTIMDDDRLAYDIFITLASEGFINISGKDCEFIMTQDFQQYMSSDETYLNVPIYAFISMIEHSVGLKITYFDYEV